MVHKMKTLEEVLYDYTRGEKTLEEANKALKELGCGLTLDPVSYTHLDVYKRQS